MIIIGELINSSREVILNAIENRTPQVIRKIAADQVANSADYIDVNAGTLGEKEGQSLAWLVENVQKEVNVPCAIDSPDPRAIEAALAVHQGNAMINSISLEKERYDKLIPIVAGTELKVVAICMSDEGMPQTADDRVRIANKLVNGLLKNNVPIENIFVDPLVQPISVNSQFGVEFISAVEKVLTKFPGINTVCGISNISYGLPNRNLLNSTFIVQAIANGLNAAIINPMDKLLVSRIFAAEALSGKDNYCMNYLKAFRSGMFA